MDALSECVHVHHMHVSCPWRLEEGISLKRALDIVEIELQMVVSHERVLSMEPGSSGRAVTSLNNWNIFTASLFKSSKTKEALARIQAFHDS